ncbi:GM14181 [Drosophila sechellia]|uniref:GM14181 n=1 Tax=Drosophila sechellia TaxID=7238 RepID=B4HVY5_DROSE|nr:GM14181 [Drosophila sechellia]
MSLLSCQARMSKDIQTLPAIIQNFEPESETQVEPNPESKSGFRIPDSGPNPTRPEREARGTHFDLLAEMRLAADELLVGGANGELLEQLRQLEQVHFGLSGKYDFECHQPLE